MKKYITTLFALALAIGSIAFVGCGGEPAEDTEANEEGGLTDIEKEMQKKKGFVTGQGSDTNTPDNNPK